MNRFVACRRAPAQIALLCEPALQGYGQRTKKLWKGSRWRRVQWPRPLSLLLVECESRGIKRLSVMIEEAGLRDPAEQDWWAGLLREWRAWRTP